MNFPFSFHLAMLWRLSEALAMTALSTARSASVRSTVDIAVARPASSVGENGRTMCFKDSTWETFRPGINTSYVILFLCFSLSLSLYYFKYSIKHVYNFWALRYL